MTLTESLAMHPAVSVSGFYLTHPQAQYFNVGRVGNDQVQDMAARRGVAVEEVRRWLGRICEVIWGTGNMLIFYKNRAIALVK